MTNVERYERAKQTVNQKTTTVGAGAAYAIAAVIVIIANKLGANFDSVETPIVSTGVGVVLSFFTYDNISRWVALFRGDSDNER